MIGSIRTVARRELKGFIDLPTAYVLAIAFLGISLFLAFRSMFAAGVASLRPLFDLLPILFAVFIPAVTMRSLAEERRGRTLDWLMAQPVSEIDVVAGKFLGNWLFVLLTLAGTVPMAIGVLLASDADIGIVVSQYVGAMLLAGQLVAVGLWASSVTRNQITAFIIASVISFTLFLIGLPIVQIGLPPLLSGALARLSVVSHFENVARGVIDLRDVLYFVSAAAVFLVLAVAAVSRERLSPLQAEARRLRVGAAVMAAIAVILNLLGSHIRGRLDLTRDNLFTLSDGTRGILGGLDDMVQVTLFTSSGLPPEIQLELRDIRDLLADMRHAAGGNFAVREVDPDRNEDAAKQASSFGIGPVEFNVLRDEEYQVRRGYYGLALTYADRKEAFPVIQHTEDLEFQLASAISKMTSDKHKGIVFLSDGGARSSYQIPGLERSLAERYDVSSRSLAGDSTPGLDRDSVSVLVVAGPTQLLDSLAVDRVRSFIDGGGSALLLLDPVDIDPRTAMPRPIATGLDPLVESRGIHMSGRLVADLASAERVSLGRRGLFNVVAPYPLWPITVPAGENLMTRGLQALTMGWAGTLDLTDSIHATPLWVTSEAAGLRDPGMPIMPDQPWNIPDDQLARRVVAAAANGHAAEVAGTATDAAGPGRLVVVADATFADAQFLQGNPQNLTFIANAIDWLAEDDALIGIRSKNRIPPVLVFESDASRNVLKWGNLAGVPLLFALAGVLRVMRRRHRAENRWREVVA